MQSMVLGPEDTSENLTNNSVLIGLINSSKERGILANLAVSVTLVAK